MAEHSHYGDPLSIPFWEAAWRRELRVQHCESCGCRQFYPRPFCLVCYSDDLTWVVAAGTAIVYSQTTVLVGPEPYTVALVDLAEGPRIMTRLIGGPVEIGDPVQLGWQDRDELPPLPVFVAAQPTAVGRNAAPDPTS